MANNKTSAETTATTAQESVYTAQELADNHKIFGTYREIVVVALRQAGNGINPLQ